MKAKIFSKLKQEYASLGLGDETLQGLAESLSGTGLVTDENVDLVVANQKSHLESLQKQNDARVSKALEKQRLKLEEEARKREEEAKAKAEAEKAAADKAEAEKAQAEKEAAEKAEAEKAAQEKTKAEQEATRQEAQRLAEIEKSKAVPEEILNLFKEAKAKAAEERKESERRLAEMGEQVRQLLDSQAAQKKGYDETIRKLMESNETLKSGYDALNREKEEAIKAKERADRMEFIMTKARELGIPQWRVDEGFVIPDDAGQEAIAEKLGSIAKNISTQMLPPERKAFRMTSGEPTKDDIDSLAASIVSKTK